jgi:hypothetical protein
MNTPRRAEVEEVREALERQREKAKPPISWIGTPLTPPSPELLSQSPLSAEPKTSFQLSSRGAKSGGKPDKLRRTNAQIAEDSAKLLQGQPRITTQFVTEKNKHLSKVDIDDLEAQKTPTATTRPSFNFIER